MKPPLVVTGDRALYRGRTGDVRNVTARFAAIRFASGTCLLCLRAELTPIARRREPMW